MSTSGGRGRGLSTARAPADGEHPGVRDVCGDVGELAVGVLARDPEQVEGLLPGDAVLVHEDADGDPDLTVALEGVPQVLGAVRGLLTEMPELAR